MMPNCFHPDQSSFPIPFSIPGELTIDNVPLYRYNLSESAFDRVTNRSDCYDSEPSLPDGISDASKCYFSKCLNLLEILNLYINERNKNFLHRFTKIRTNKTMPTEEYENWHR